MNRNKIQLFFNKYRLHFMGLLVALIFAIIIKQFFYYNEIIENKKETIGVVYKIKYTSRGDNSLYYYYYVNTKKYYGATSVNSFYGYNKRKGCVGCSFKVYYSSKDPSKSSIRLGEYEEYKRTVEFGQFD